MNKLQLERHKKMIENDLRLRQAKHRIVREDFFVNSDDRYDDLDQATRDNDQSMSMRMSNKDNLYIKKLKDALLRVGEGTYGICEDCGSEIELNRLKARLTATKCVSCKEDEERQELLTATGRKHKSLGESFSKQYA